MEETHQRLRLVVHVAESGHSFQVDCQASTSIELVQRTLASLSGVPSHDQLLVCEDARLEPQRSLGYYKLPAEGRHVFLFNRVRLMADSPPLPVEWLGVKEPVMPPPPSASLCGHPLDHASDPALRALPSYERQFRYHFQKGHAYFGSSQDKFEACRQLHREQQVQNMALETAKGNVDHYYKIIDQMYQDFMKHFNRQHKQHAYILVKLNRDLERLRACRLHPHLISENRRTLLDCVNEASMQKHAEVCTDSHKQFESKVLQLKSIYLELQHNVQDLLCTMPSVDIHSLERMITENTHIIEEEGSIMQSLSKDVDTVKRLVDDCVASHSSVSLRPHDAVSALGPMYDVHDKNHIPRIVACYQKLGKLLEYFRAKKHEMSLCVHSCMQRVAALQSSIRDMRNQLSAFKEAMDRQDEMFSELKVVRRIGPAYRACLSEVVRRKAGMKLYMGQAGQLAEKMARKRDSEVAGREQFFRVQSVFIPLDMLASMGLCGAPSQCVVNIEPYDKDLLDIDIKDVERYAPESIVGSLLKGASAHRSQGKFSCEGSGSHSDSMEDSTVNMKCNGDIEALEDGTNDEIAGTSKIEVENAWLKAELASAIALLCSLDVDFDKDFADESEESKLRASGRHAAEKTSEALSLKDEHAKHLQDMLKASQLQCNSYKKRIHELEQKISDQYNELHMQSLNGADGQSRTSLENCERATVKSESSGITGEARMLNAQGTLEALDDGISSSPPVDVSQPLLSDASSMTNQTGRAQEGVAETVDDFAGGLSAADVGMLNEREGSVAKEHVKEFIGVEMQQAFNLMASPVQDGTSTSLDLVQEEDKGSHVIGTVAVLCKKDEQLKSLQKALLHKTNQCAVAEEKLKSALEDLVCIRTELEGNTDLLSECQMNCAHLENRLHDAREEARTKQCSAERKAAEYNALRTSSVKLRGLVERLRHCISASQASTTGLAESLRALVIALNSSDVGDDGTGDFRTCVRLLAERVGWLAQQQSELRERCTLAEASQSHLAAELGSKTELLKSQYAKHKIDKQAKICFTRFKVHELAVFLPNAAGHYEALNRNCPHYFLSDESVALFLANLPSGQLYVIGQIVHIDRNVARMAPQSSSISVSGREPNTMAAGSRSVWNPYGLTVGTEYFVVTVAMIPDQMPSTVV